MTSASVDFKMRNAAFLLFDRWMPPPFAKGNPGCFFFVGRQVVSGHAGHWLETAHLREGWEDFAGKNWKDYCIHLGEDYPTILLKFTIRF